MRPLVLCALLCALVLTGAARADVPDFMSYQGVLKDSTGARVPDGLYDLTFRLYTAPMGGSAVWTEMQSVSATDGVVDAMLGDLVPLGKNLFGQELWLGISVDYEPELYPRTQLTTAPYAFRAAVAESLIGGGGSGGDTDWFFNGTGDIYRLSGDVGIGVTEPTARLDVVAPSGSYAIHATASDSMNSAGRFVSEGNGVGLVANSHGWGSALYSLAQGTGYSGHFVGGNGVRIDGMCEVNAFQMYANSTAGHVLTSDGSGVGTWQAPAAMADSDWTVLGDDMYSSVSGNVGVGTTTPTAKLHVQGGIDVDGFRMVPGASPGRVLASDGTGNGSWQDPAGLPDFDWTVSGADMYATVAGNIGIGTTTPSAKLDVEGNLDVGGRIEVNGTVDRTAEFYTTDCDWNTQVVRAVVIGTEQADATGVYGRSTPAHAYGVGGRFIGGDRGVWAESWIEGDSGLVESGIYGVFAHAWDEYGLEDDIHVTGVYGWADSGIYSVGVKGWGEYGTEAAIGVYGYARGGGTTNLAGYFYGSVDIAGTLSKAAGSFKIDHPLDPENMYLSHSFVESPDMMNVYNGNVVLDSRGEAWVEMPDWFEALNRDFRYQLTAVGAPGPNLHIAEEMNRGRFTIGGGEPGMKVSWQVTGIRQDRYAEENRIVVEEHKLPQDAGQYLHPQLYGRAEEEGIGYLAPGDVNQGR